MDGSLKNAYCDKRGTKGGRPKVIGETKLPKNWVAFLKDARNKEEFFHFLNNLFKISINYDGKKVYCTKYDTALLDREDHDTKNLAPCTHEEADIRIIR